MKNDKSHNYYRGNYYLNKFLNDFQDDINDIAHNLYIENKFKTDQSSYIDFLIDLNEVIDAKIGSFLKEQWRKLNANYHENNKR